MTKKNLQKEEALLVSSSKGRVHSWRGGGLTAGGWRREMADCISIHTQAVDTAYYRGAELGTPKA